MGFYKQLFQTIYYILRSLKMIFTKKNMFFFLFIAVFVACCVFSNKVFAEESLTFERIYNVRLDSQNRVIVAGENAIDFIGTDSNYIYTFTNISRYNVALGVYCSNSQPAVGVSYFRIVNVEPNESYTFVGGDNLFYFYDCTTSESPRFSASRSPINEYDNTIEILTQAISLDNLWGQFGVGLIALAVLFALGFLVVRKVLKKDSNYKG